MKVAIVGSGNVAYHLIRGFVDSGITISMVYAHTDQGAKRLENLFKIPITTNFSQTADADVFIIAVKDSVIAEVASKFRGRPLVHTAGAVDIDILSFYTQRYGVFYPFQTFRKEYDIDWKQVPIFVEACCPEFEQLLENLGRSLSSQVYFLSSSKRKYLHLSGVLVNNFINHLLYYSKQVLEDNGLDFEWVFPLLEQTIKNIRYFNPYDVQTGPAKRGDFSSINAHLELLEKYPKLKEIYSVITSSITELYREDGRDK